MVYVGTFETGKLIAYPIKAQPDARGRVLTNWVGEIARPNDGVRDWNRRAAAVDFVDALAAWSFDWLDVPAMIHAAETILEYAMIDQEPLPGWTDGRITLVGDAAHAMLPRGSNGAAQAIIDGRVLAGALSAYADPREALSRHEAERRPATEAIVRANREAPPDAILRVVHERTQGRRFDDIDAVVTRQEREEWQARYRAVAGFERTAS